MDSYLKHKIQSANRQKRPKNKFADPKTFLWILNPIHQTILWISTLLIGVWSSLSAQKIMDFHLPWDAPEQAVINYYTLSYFSLIVIVLLMFSITKWVARHQDSYVIDSLLTMPPSSFWDYYHERYKTVLKLAYLNEIALDETIESYGSLINEKKMRETAKEHTKTSIFDKAIYEFEKLKNNNPEPVSLDDKIEKQKSEVQKAISEAEQDVRRILDICVNMMKLWDKNNMGSSDVVYRANVMKIYRFSEDHNDETLEEITKLAKPYTIVEGENHYSGYVGILDSIYSTTTSSEDPEPDNIKPIAFPFTSIKDLKNGSISSPFKTSIMGAPLAAAEDSLSYVNSPEDIVQYYEKSCNVNKDILENIKENYLTSSKTESILSIPISSYAIGECRYILNLYRNEVGLLYKGQKNTDFNSIVHPLTTLLANTIYVLDDFKARFNELDSI